MPEVRLKVQSVMKGGKSKRSIRITERKMMEHL